MDKDNFNNLDVMDQVQYINTLLENKRSLTQISKDLGIGRSTISGRFKKHGYIFNKQLIKYIEYEGIESYTNVPLCNTKALRSLNNNDLIKYNNCNTDVNNKILNITNEYETLMQIIELYKYNSNILQNKIIIDLPKSESELTSFRVNKEILEQFNEFTKEHTEFKKIDLVSMALKEYIDNHKSIGKTY